LYNTYLELGIEEEFTVINYDKEKNPELYEIWKLPAVWERGTKLNQHIDTVMHLILLGSCKNHYINDSPMHHRL
jgi:hypothetical protein